MTRSQHPAVVTARAEIEAGHFYGSQYSNADKIARGFAVLDAGTKGPTEEEVVTEFLRWLPPGLVAMERRADLKKLAKDFAERKRS